MVYKVLNKMRQARKLVYYDHYSGEYRSRTDDPLLAKQVL